MEFTTCLGLHYQATRLSRTVLNASGSTLPYGAFTLYGSLPKKVVNSFDTSGKLMRRNNDIEPFPYAAPHAVFSTAAYALGSSLFSRPYSGNPCWFLFLRLLICLNSAGNLTRARLVLEKKTVVSIKSSGHGTSHSLPRIPSQVRPRDNARNAAFQPETHGTSGTRTTTIPTSSSTTAFTRATTTF